MITMRYWSVLLAILVSYSTADGAEPDSDKEFTRNINPNPTADVIQSSSIVSQATPTLSNSSPDDNLEISGDIDDQNERRSGAAFHVWPTVIVSKSSVSPIQNSTSSRDSHTSGISDPTANSIHTSTHVSNDIPDCRNRSYLNYAVENGVPTYCVIRRITTKYHQYNGKCVKIADLWNRLRNSSMADRLKYHNIDHQWLSHYEYRVIGDEVNAYIALRLILDPSIGQYMKTLAPNLAFDELENTAEDVRIIGSNKAHDLKPYSACKILMDNNIFQFIDDMTIYDCPAVQPKCKKSEYYTPKLTEGVYYGVKFGNTGMDEKCLVRNLGETRCIKLNVAEELMNKFNGVSFNQLKEQYSIYRRKIYDGSSEGFLQVYQRTKSMAKALTQFTEVLDLAEEKVPCPFANNETVKIGAVTMCNIFSMHVPFEDALLWRHSEEC